MTQAERVSTRLWILLGFALLAGVWTLTHAPKAHAQEFVPGASADADASGGDGGSARGGDGGRGGDGVLPTCNGNANSVDLGDEDALECAAGGIGGAGGDAGESVGGNGGIAFTIGRQQPPASDAPAETQPDLAVALTGVTPIAGLCVAACAVEHTFTITNIGDAIAPAVSFTDTLSIASGAGTIVGTAGGPPGACTSNGPFSTVTLTCPNLGDLAPGASLVLRVTSNVALLPVASTLNVTGVASTPAAERTLTNNTANGSTTIIPI